MWHSLLTLVENILLPIILCSQGVIIHAFQDCKLLRVKATSKAQVRDSEGDGAGQPKPWWWKGLGAGGTCLAPKTPAEPGLEPVPVLLRPLSNSSY
ncbi:hypothetical protein WN943_009526 [Citrus x changshan-huyou]